MLTLSLHLEINKDLFDFNDRNIFRYSVNLCRVAKIQQQTLSDSDDVQLVAVFFFFTAFQTVGRF